MANWDEIHKKKGRVFGTQPSAIVKEALNLWKPADSPTALDIGSYTGRNAIFLAKQGFQVTALDPSEEALDDLKKIAQEENVECITALGVIEKFDWPGNFDVILAINVLHAVKDTEQVIADIRDHTAPNGINILTVFTEKVMPKQRNYIVADKLKEIYSGWKILKIQERVTGLAIPAQGKDKATVVDLIAQKA